MATCHLLVDIGGTNARLALQDGVGAALHSITQLACADFDGAEALLRHYLTRTNARPTHGAIGIASPVGGDLVQMTNLPWSFSTQALQRALGLETLLVLNDFTALAMALPVLAPDEFRQVGGGHPVAGRAWALLGPGTGLGVGGLLSAPGGGYSPIAGEGGHVTLAGHDDVEDAVLREVRRWHGHASAERVLSGPGLLTLLRAVEALAGSGTVGAGSAASAAGDAPEASAAIVHPRDVVAQAMAGTNAHCVTAVDLFFALLGSAAGNLALTLGAQRGVFIGGGIVPAMGRAIDGSRFRERFEAKGRYADYLRHIPTYVIDTPSPPALRGAAQALAQVIGR